MKILTGLFFFYSLKLFSVDYIFDSRGGSEQKILKFQDKSKFIHLTTNGLWVDSKGNYGSEVCYGSIEISGENENLDILCEITDQEGIVLIVSRKRNSLIGGGIGINIYIEVPEKYNFLKEKKCTYAVTQSNTNFFYKQKCKLD
ncbi:MAG: hypothetical protein VX089_03935 [Pseudomonadota bacterium]|nr:hypothetical protein [Pseudomonadota bacterium]